MARRGRPTVEIVLTSNGCKTLHRRAAVIHLRRLWRYIAGSIWRVPTRKYHGPVWPLSSGVSSLNESHGVSVALMGGDTTVIVDELTAGSSIGDVAKRSSLSRWPVRTRVLWHPLMVPTGAPVGLWKIPGDKECIESSLSWLSTQFGAFHHCVLSDTPGPCGHA